MHVQTKQGSYSIKLSYAVEYTKKQQQLWNGQYMKFNKVFISYDLFVKYEVMKIYLLREKEKVNIVNKKQQTQKFI